jgi:TldD protein
LRELTEVALKTAKRSGASYADIRICYYKNQNISARDRIITSLNTNENSGFGVRAFVNGGWGFASSSVISKNEIKKRTKLAVEIARASAMTLEKPLKLADVPAYVDYWQTPFIKDPFKIPVERKVELLLKINEKMLKVRGVMRAISRLGFISEHKYFGSTIGSFIEQLIIRSSAYYTAVAVGPAGFETRSFPEMPLNKGYEHIEELPLLYEAERIASEAVQKLSAKPSPIGEKDLILLPSHLALTIHESVGHATELDRVLGWEADYAGTSFATPEKQGNFHYGSKLVNLVGDRSIPNLRSSVGYDDDGVKTKSFYIVREGILNDYATTRDTAPLIGAEESNACSYADSWYNTPILRMPNLSLEAGGKDAPTLEALIADTRDAILIDGMGSYSIDHQRRNFQFGGDAFFEVKNGKKGVMLKDVTYQSNTPEFWGSVDAICGEAEWKPYGVEGCGKGQPGQRAQMTHGSSPVRVRKIKVGGAKL